MTPETISGILFLFQELIKAVPTAVIEIQKILQKSDPTPEDWAALRARVATLSYEDYVPETDLPKA